MIAALLNLKGGGGKTTLAIHLAQALSKQGRALLIDADPQGSAVTWSEVRETTPPFSVVALAKPTIHRDIASISEGYDHVVIDGPPRATDLARSVIMASDLVLIPCQPSAFDLWAAEDTIKIINEALVLKPALRAMLVLNRKIANTAVSKAARTAMLELGLPVVTAEIAQRVVFAEAAAAGSTVNEQQPQGAAAREIDSFTKEVMELAA